MGPHNRARLNEGAPDASALAQFNLQLNDLFGALESAGYAGLKDWYIQDIHGDFLSVVLRHTDDIVEGLFINAKGLNLGILFGVVIPQALSTMRAALA